MPNIEKEAVRFGEGRRHRRNASGYHVPGVVGARGAQPQNPIHGSMTLVSKEKLATQKQSDFALICLSGRQGLAVDGKQFARCSFPFAVCGSASVRPPAA